MYEEESGLQLIVNLFLDKILFVRHCASVLLVTQNCGHKKPVIDKFEMTIFAKLSC